jgi:hypothetical protein
MRSAGDNRFQELFEDEKYVAMKNYLYNDGKNRNFWKEEKANQAPPGRLFKHR